MGIPAIGEDVKRALDSLTDEDLKGMQCYAFDHELMAYGTQALAHSYIMQMARDVAEGRMPLEAFAEKYGLGPSEDPVHKGMEGPLSAIANDGIFIPRAGFRFRDERAIQYFNMDLPNRLRHGNWRDREGAYGLMKNSVKAGDLKDPGMVERGIIFSEDLWEGCVEGFEKSAKGRVARIDKVKTRLKTRKVPVYENVQPERITELGRELIRYWSRIILPGGSP